MNANFEAVAAGLGLSEADVVQLAKNSFRGSFLPEVEKVSFLQSAAGPVLKLLRQAKDLFGGRCEVFYAGSVAPPI